MKRILTAVLVAALAFSLVAALAGCEKKDDAAKAAAKFAETAKQESDAEALIIAKGFSDCIVIVKGDNVDVAVPADQLSDAQSLQIKEIIMKQLKAKSENIAVVPVK